MKWIVLLLAIATNASASVLLKSVVSSGKRQSILVDPLSYLTSVSMWVGLVLYGMAFLFYTASLSQFPLNVAHPVITAGAIVTVVAASALIFGEVFDGFIAFGIALVLTGLIIIGTRLGQ